MSGQISGDSSLQPINAITQFVNGTQAAWSSVTIPVPQGMVVYATDTTVVKMGDGSTLYANLPVLFTLSSLSSLVAQIAAVAVIANAAAAEDITFASEIAALQASLATVSAQVGVLGSNTYATQIATLTAEYGTISSDYTSLETAVNALQTTVAGISTTIAPYPSKLNTLNSEYSNLSGLITALQNTVNTLSTTLSPIPSQITTINNTLNVLTSTDQVFYIYYRNLISETIRTILTNNLTNYQLLDQLVIFPSVSKTGSFVVKAYSILTGESTGAVQQNYMLSLSDGTNITNGSPNLVYADAANTDIATDAYFMSSVKYAPGSSVIFTLSLSTLGGGAKPGFMSGTAAYIELVVEQA